jgi:hypothetical protein
MIMSSTSWQSDGASAEAVDQEGFGNHCAEVKAIKIEFKRVADSLAPLGFKGRKIDVFNLMAWEIGDLRRAFSRVASNRKGGSRDEVC